MIKKLRQRFIMIAMLSITVVLFSLISVIDILSYVDTMKTLDERLEILCDNNGTFPKNDLNNNNDSEPQPPNSDLSQDELQSMDPANKNDQPGEQPRSVAPNGNMTPDGNMEPGPNNNMNGKTNGLGIVNLFSTRVSEETPYNTRYFTVKLDNDGNVILVNTGKIAAVSSSQASSYAKDLFAEGKKEGFYNYYKYKAVTSDSETLYVFLSCESEIRTLTLLILVSIIVLFVGVLLVYILVRVLTKIAIKPVEESYAKQKRFITDASHEIKTPLAIIDANTEVIEMEAGESEWTKSTRKQIKRLTELTQKLIFLSRMDEEDHKIEMLDFNLGQLLFDTVNSYESMLKGKKLETRIDTEIKYHGNHDNILQMFGLLMDNALKYADENGTIRVFCQKKGKHIIISFYNTVENIQKGNLDVLFERFYRTDASRNSKTGGYGIGLSVVKAVVEAHKGEIHCESSDGKSILFTILL